LAVQVDATCFAQVVYLFFPETQMDDMVSSYNQSVCDQATMTSPPKRLRAHDCDAHCAGLFRESL
jgi:hypothetical protein